MSTVKSNKNNKKSSYLERFAQIAKLGEIVFHSRDLANLWQIDNKNTLNTTLKRYAKQGILYRIHRGFYSLKPPEEVEPFLLGLKVLHRYAYIGVETILSLSGFIQQQVNSITIVSSQSRRFSINGYCYYCRQLDDKFLYNPAGIIEENGIKKANIERAIADLLYFNPRFHLDTQNINWKKVKEIQQMLGYPLTPKRYQ